jgi:hypothetical protein
MEIIVHPYDTNDQKLLGDSYQRLLAVREKGLSAMKPFINDQGYLSGIIIDSIISGLMEHFQEVVRMPDDHARQFFFWGEGNTSATYVKDRVDSIVALVNSFPESSPSSAHPQTPQEADEVRERAVKS